MNRRELLKLIGAAAGMSGAAAALAACGGESPGSDATAAATNATGGTPSTAASGSAAPTAVRKVNFGFIALTDAASLIMAKELGYFADRSIDAQITKQASWPALRDALQTGQIDAAHCLFSMPFSVATKVGGNGATDLRIAMILNNNGQAITLSNELKATGYGDLSKVKALLEASNAPELAMTFPGGTHDLWLRYWLAAAKVDASKLKIAPVPPPQMVQNMTVGNVKGYCVGEPWNAVAVTNGIGFTALATQDLWLHHPEKALVANEGFASDHVDTLADVMAAVLKAAKWLDVPANRAMAADTLGQEKYVNAKPEAIRGRLTGVYDLGASLGTKDFAGEQMLFFRDGATSFPRRSYGHWVLAQYERLGLLQGKADHTLVDRLILSDLYRDVAKAEGVPVPDDDMAPIKIRLDGVTFDPTKPEAEAARKG